MNFNTTHLFLILLFVSIIISATGVGLWVDGRVDGLGAGLAWGGGAAMVASTICAILSDENHPF